jgi:hypothetical protein
MARIKIQDLVVDEALDSKALSFVWGGAGVPRPRGLLALRPPLVPGGNSSPSPLSPPRGRDR